jgi:SAM-dependent methyltransferase
VALAGERCAGLPAVSLMEGDLFVLAGGPLRGSFDWVFEHTCYCAIPRERRADYAAAVQAALRPGGHLLAVFFLRPWDDHEDQEQGPPFGTSTDSLDAMFADGFELIDRWQPAAAYPGREGREEMRLFRRRP